MTDHGELIQLHLGHILAIDGAMSQETGSTDHGRGHAITDEQDDVFGTALGWNVTNQPVSHGLLVAVVCQSSFILTGLIKSNTAVGLGGDIHKRRLLGILGIEVCLE